MAISSAAPAVGALIAGRYRIEHHVGEGGMGAVWVAEDEKLHRWVAVKLLGERLSPSRSARERFEREAMALARLRSPHVVQVFDYGIDAATGPFMVMELLHGEDLYSWLKRNRPAPLGLVAAIVLQACKGLGAAHRAGIVHRDLKPANVYVVRDHEEQTIKIFDFGLAKAVGGAGPLRDRTGEGVLLGTPRYMSPEQAHGAKQVDHRSDLWSLAVIAYLAVTGTLPFRGTGVGEVIAKIQKEPHKKPSELNAELPAALDDFFERALAKDPAARFQSAQEFADALGAIGPALTSEGVAAELRAPVIAEDQGDTELEDERLGALADGGDDTAVERADPEGGDEPDSATATTARDEQPPAADPTLADEPSSFELATTKIAPESLVQVPRRRKLWPAAALLVAAGIGAGVSWRVAGRMRSASDPHPSASDPHPGVSDPHPGVSDPHPGVSDPHPSALDPHPSVSDPHPGALDPHPSVIDPRQGVSDPHPSALDPRPGVIDPRPSASEPHSGANEPVSSPAAPGVAGSSASAAPSERGLELFEDRH